MNIVYYTNQSLKLGVKSKNYLTNQIIFFYKQKNINYHNTKHYLTSNLKPLDLFINK